jgi:hypothetical protein
MDASARDERSLPDEALSIVARALAENSTSLLLPNGRDAP